MGMYLNEKGYLCYVRRGLSLSDTHGASAGHAEAHLREYEEVSNRIVDEKLKAFQNGLESELTQIITNVCANVWNEVAQRTLSAFTQETHTAVNVAFNDGLDILRSEKTRKFITDNIAKRAQIELSKIKPTIRL